MSAFVRACEVCDRDRVANPSPRTPLGYLPADQPFAALYIDIVGGHGSLSLGASPKSILTMIDGLTGWAEAVPIADQSAPTVARAVYTEWISRYGVPEQLHSDRGVQFESAVFAELCAVFEIEKTQTTPYRPQANGKCERFNRTLISMLRRAVQKRPYYWEPLLSPMLQTYRSTISEATGFTPYRLTFGREMRLPIDLGTPLPEPPRDIRTMAAEVAENLVWSYQIAREIIGFGHRRAESRYKDKIVEKQYKPGSLVRVVQHTHPYGVPSKLNSKFSGLCKVLEVRGPTLTLRKLYTNKVFTASHDAVRTSTLSRPEVPLQAELPAELPNALNAESSAEDLEVGCVENLRLFADDEWLPPSASQIPSLIDLDLTPPPAVSSPLSQTQLTLVFSVMFVSLHVSRPLSRVPSPCRHSQVSLLYRCHGRSHPLLNLPSLVLLEPIYPRISHQSGRKR